MKRNLAIRMAAVTGLLLVGLAVAASGGWGVLALLYSGSQGAGWRNILAVVFGGAVILTIIALCMRRWRWRGFAAYVVLFGLLLGWFRGIEPSNERDWQADVAKLRQGIDQDLGRTITRLMRDKYPKLKAQIQGDAVRISGSSKDMLQGAMKMLREQDYVVPLQFNNYR